MGRDEPREGLLGMLRSNCIIVGQRPHGILLDTFSGVMRLYPFVMRASAVLQKLV